jgi:hypothetical protein
MQFDQHYDIVLFEMTGSEHTGEQRTSVFFDYVIFRVTCVDFWKRVITYALVVVVVGHLIEYAYNYDLTVADQAYLINDLCYAALITVCAFFVIPPLEQRIACLNSRTQTIALLCSIAFVGALTLWYLSTYFSY